MSAAKNIIGSGGKASDCIFCKIIEGGLPSYKVYEDASTLAFLDIFPIHHGHVLVISKRHTVDIFDTPEEDLRSIMAAAKKISPAVMKATKADGINIGMNNRPSAGQVVMHAHVHVIPRFKDDGLKTWPQKPYNNDAEKEHVMERIKAAL
ncbi:HIT family protein [Candidatus Woesearchaeota archaeon]|nr:HIT family protein [Candidatus Woesearchaeota archaeon]